MRKDYEALLARLGELEDARDLAAALAAPPESFLPAKAVERLLAGESPVRVWREQRGMKASELAAAAGVSRSYLSEIESGRKTGSAKALAAIARVLSVTVDDLI